MRFELKQFLRDLNTAVQLQSTDAVDITLNGLMGMAGVSGNDRMSEGIIAQVVLPAGEILSGLPSSILRPLIDNSLAMGRAIGAAALAHRFLREGDVKPEDLRRLGSDPRSDVRLALGLSLRIMGEKNPKNIFSLGSKWIKDSSPRLRQTALFFLSSLADSNSHELFSLLYSLETEEDNHVKSALVDALTMLGNEGKTSPVLQMLSAWSATPTSNSWIICRTLSASWAARFPEKVASILRGVHKGSGNRKMIEKTLEALRRNGVDVEFNNDLWLWMKAET